MFTSHLVRFFIVGGFSACALASSLAAGPVTFSFAPPPASAPVNPFARELWAEVVTPSGRTLVLPAYYEGNDRFAVRARADEVGPYRLGLVAETTAGQPAHALTVSGVSPAVLENKKTTRLPFIQIDPKNPAGFARSDGHPFFPVGANLAWAPVDPLAYYHRAMPAFARANLNWMRVWMAHWGALNLDWLPAALGPSPKPGSLDPRIAENWDKLLADAEDNGVYLQLVLQHHGQFTTGANSNWADNPWNAANPGGFLRTPGEFFTSPDARVMTMLKYRYIVARWGWSPAIFAWELFNEVHWVDAMDRDRDEVSVARWHAELATFIRSVDVYHHLITTSTEDLRSPIYAQMDFYQPHLYAANLLAGARSFFPSAKTLTRPIFYGETGDDQLPLSPEVKKSGVALVPVVWASIMGEGNYAAQPWEGAKLIAQNRLGELGAVFRFLAINRVPAQTGLVPFSAVVETTERVPLRLAAGQSWSRHPPPDFTFPLDGREPLQAAEIPSALVGTPEGIAAGFVGHATYHLDFPRATIVRINVAATGANGSALSVKIDGELVAEQRWAPHLNTPAELAFPVTQGPHTLVVENSGGPDWVKITDIDLGLDAPVVAAIGRRNDHFIMAWLWHRTNLYALAPATPATGTLALDAVPAGKWSVTWWDTLKGTTASSSTIDHPGGVLKLTTPPILRHAAVVLSLAP